MENADHDGAMDDQTQRLLLRIYGQKALECRYHHVITTVAMRGAPRHATVFHLSGTSYEADASAMQPFMRGVILTPQLEIVPNMAHTPRAVYSPALVTTLLHEEPETVMVMPALNARLVRMFRAEGAWQFATNRGPCARRTSIVTRFRHAIECQSGLTLAQVEQQLDPGRVWFFLLPREGAPPVYVLGSTELLRLENAATRWRIRGDGRLQVHPQLPSGVPRVPTLRSVLASSGHADVCGGVSAWQAARLDAETLRYADQFNGVMILNPQTLTAVRVVDPLAFLLGRLVEGRERDPRNTIVRVLLTHYIVGGSALSHFPHRMQLAFAIHAALGALAHLFPAEYMLCADHVFPDVHEGRIPRETSGGGFQLSRLVASIVRSM